MKNLSLLIWLTQLGLSVALPLGGFVWLGVWLRQRFGWGGWVVILCTVVGVICAVDGFRSSLKAMEPATRGKKEKDPPVAFNEHE